MEQLKFELYEEEMLSPLGGHELTEMELFVAGLLLGASRENPVGIKAIIHQVNAHKGIPISERSVKKLIRALRKEHTFPIIASRQPPTGYWWCSSPEEMSEFIESFRAQALDELHTLSLIVRHNFPALSGQLNFQDHGELMKGESDAAGN